MNDDELTVHGFETSNNIKVRVALGYKALPYTFCTIDPADRAGIVELSGQFLTPVLVHRRAGEASPRVLFDSAAILRYLDTTFPDTPKLFGTSRDQQWAIEDHELFARATLAAPMLELVHRNVAGDPVGDGEKRVLEQRFEQAARQVASNLGTREWLVGDALSAADITTAAVFARIERSGLFALPAEVTAGACRAWIDRVIAWDRPAA